MELNDLINHMRQGIEMAEQTGDSVGYIHSDTVNEIHKHLVDYRRLLMTEGRHHVSIERADQLPERDLARTPVPAGIRGHFRRALGSGR